MASEGCLQDIVCCIGQPVGGNPTQFMMERAFAAAGLDWRFLTLEVSPHNLGDAVRGMRAMRFRGASITLPHRVAVTQFLDGRSDVADLIGAVNCVYRLNDQLIGENTDGKGFLQSLRAITDPKGKRVVVFGAGGVARAITAELALAGAAGFTVVNRTAERGQALVDLLNERLKVPSQFIPWEAEYRIEEGTDIVIQATSIGLGDDAARVPLDVRSLQPPMLVADVTVNPGQTRLLIDAADRGCQTLPGPSMLVHRGALDFKIWTGMDPDVGVLRDAMEEYLEL